MKKRKYKEGRGDIAIENSPAFKAAMEKAFAEYKARGGISADELIRQMASSCHRK